MCARLFIFIYFIKPFYSFIISSRFIIGVYLNFKYIKYNMAGIINGYKLEEEIGFGGFGKVFIATKNDKM